MVQVFKKTRSFYSSAVCFRRTPQIHSGHGNECVMLQATPYFSEENTPRSVLIWMISSHVERTCTP